MIESKGTEELEGRNYHTGQFLKTLLREDSSILWTPNFHA